MGGCYCRGDQDTWRVASYGRELALKNEADAVPIVNGKGDIVEA
jgi:hypothetical protein